VARILRFDEYIAVQTAVLPPKELTWDFLGEEEDRGEGGPLIRRYLQLADIAFQGGQPPRDKHTPM
jgi:hypothetical protein